MNLLLGCGVCSPVITVTTTPPAPYFSQPTIQHCGRQSLQLSQYTTVYSYSHSHIHSAASFCPQGPTLNSHTEGLWGKEAVGERQKRCKEMGFCDWSADTDMKLEGITEDITNVSVTGKLSAVGCSVSRLRKFCQIWIQEANRIRDPHHRSRLKMDKAKKTPANRGSSSTSKWDFPPSSMLLVNPMMII